MCNPTEIPKFDWREGLINEDEERRSEDVDIVGIVLPDLKAACTLTLN